jgi:hypothetical protein
MVVARYENKPDLAPGMDPELVQLERDGREDGVWYLVNSYIESHREMNSTTGQDFLGVGDDFGMYTGFDLKYDMASTAADSSSLQPSTFSLVDDYYEYMEARAEEARQNLENMFK